MFKNVFCVSDIMNNNDLFKKCLNLCDLPECTSPATMKKTLDSLDGYFVKKIGNAYHFYHDFIMEVTTFVFGTEYPEEIIVNADIGFLRKRVKLEKECGDSKDTFVIYVSDIQIKYLVDRFLRDIVGDRFMEVVLNPCLRNGKLIDMLIEKLTNEEENVKLFVEKITKNKEKLKQMKQNMEVEYTETRKNPVFKRHFFPKIDFVNGMGKISPLFALIVFCHDKLSLFCLKTLRGMETNTLMLNLFSAVCCNGSMDMFNIFLKEEIVMVLKENIFQDHPIHTVSEFHNHELLYELHKFNIDVNLRTRDNIGWTPLHLAITNNTTKNSDIETHDYLKRLNKTVLSLLDNGADVNLCTQKGVSPLFLACQNGNDSTAGLLLKNGADVNLCDESGSSPFGVACHKGHDSTVQLLLKNGANMNLCDKKGESPLFIACCNGHDSIVQSLLNKGADANLCTKTRASPLYIACENGHDSTVKLLLKNGAEVNLCTKAGASPLYIACQHGHASAVQLLLNNDADVNSCKESGASPLHIACQHGHNSIVQLLLNINANMNLCTKTGASPLYNACHYGHCSIVQSLLKKGADANLCTKTGASPLYIACHYGHESIVQSLLNKGADANLCTKTGTSPLYIARLHGHDSTVQLLCEHL
ncbi:uncharacterized protein LOC144626897 [Crassostrea virginica]